MWVLYPGQISLFTDPRCSCFPDTTVRALCLKCTSLSYLWRFYLHTEAESHLNHTSPGKSSPITQAHGSLWTKLNISCKVSTAEEGNRMLLCVLNNGTELGESRFLIPTLCLWRKVGTRTWPFFLSRGSPGGRRPWASLEPGACLQKLLGLFLPLMFTWPGGPAWWNLALLPSTLGGLPPGSLCAQTVALCGTEKQDWKWSCLRSPHPPPPSPAVMDHPVPGWPLCKSVAGRVR